MLLPQKKSRLIIIEDEKITKIDIDKVCDGKTCGTGKSASGGWICIHNNLLALHPHICKDWNWELNNNIGPENYKPGSGKHVWWMCPNKDCGCKIYKMEIRKRSGRNQGCRCCDGILCEHNNLTVTHPELCKLWDPKNKLGPENYTYGSNEMISWICFDDCGSGCHNHDTAINSKTNKSRPVGCPYCKHNRPCEHNNLKMLFPSICEDWDPENSKSPQEYLPYSQIEIFWICKKNSEHKWSCPIDRRTRKKFLGDDCPICESVDGKVNVNEGFKMTKCRNNMKIEDHNLLINNSLLAGEWNYEKNALRPEHYFPRSSASVWWTCKKDRSHIWNATIDSRNGKYKKSGCPKCRRVGYSKISLEWLNYVEKSENINIIHFMNGGEYKIEGPEKIGKVDGYCLETNTVYEFHGDFYHGHPSIFAPDDINGVNHKSYGYLYNKTLERDKLIISKNYNLVVMWEHEFKILRKTFVK